MQTNGKIEEPSCLTQVGIGYVYFEPDRKITVHFRHLARGSEPHAEVDVSLDTGEAIECLCEAEPINLKGSGKKKELARKLNGRAGALTVDDWLLVLDRASGEVRQRMTRTTIVPKRMVSLTPTYRSDRIADLVREGAMNILYGEGGIGKGWIAILGALCVQQGKPLCGMPVEQGDVLYLDWEDDELTLNNRVAIVAKGNDLKAEAPHYKRMIGSLSHQIEEILEYVLEHRIVLVIIDSVSKAFPRGDFGSYETTADTMAEVTALLPTTWAIDHISSAGRSSDALAGKPIGGIGKVNATRNMWEVTGHQEPETCTVYTAVHQQKQNHTARLAEHAFEMVFDDPRAPTQVTIRTTQIQNVPELAARTPVTAQVLHELRRKRSYEELYERLGAVSDRKKRNAIQAAVSRYLKKEVIVREVSEGVMRFWRPVAE